MTPRRPAPPLWFVLCVAVVLGAVIRVLSPPGAADDPGGGHAPPVQYAFWPLVIFIASAIWKGIEVAGRVTLAALVWIVKTLQLFATATWNGMKAVAHVLQVGLKAAWGFFKLTYDKVLKPAVLKFWKLYNKARKWLDDTFGPLLRHIRDVRDSILCFYKTWIRPWLDLIDVTRRLLGIFASLGLKWARALDKRLAELENKIERPFRLLLAKVNEVINLVDRVVTRNGLLQRVALIPSLARDYKYAWEAIVNPYSKPISETYRHVLENAAKPKTVTAIERDLRDYVRTGGGESADLYREGLAAWKTALGAP